MPAKALRSGGFFASGLIHNPLWHCLAAFLVVIVLGPATFAAEEPAKAEPAQVTAAIDRGLAFLAKDAVAWRDEHQCVSCHHAGTVAWAMQEAKQRGHVVDEAVMAEMTKWVAESGPGKTGVPRPSNIPKALNTKAIWFALALESLAQPNEVEQNGIKVKLATIVEDQLENGSWASWPETRPPFFGNSDESFTALATLALVPAAKAGDVAAKTALDKGLQWLTTTKTDDDPQSVAMRLLLWTKIERPVEEWQPLIRKIRERQNADGGWSQAKELASDPWATGQAMYSLSHAGVKSDDPAIQRAQLFLVKSQRPDGSWPITSRPTKPGGAGSTNLIPITGGGSSWAVLGLVRSR